MVLVGGLIQAIKRKPGLAIGVDRNQFPAASRISG